MRSNSVPEKLQEQVRSLEQAQRRFARSIPIADAIDCWMPYGGLSTGCIHEMKGAGIASVLAFSSILAARIAGDRGNIVYIAPDRSLYPVGLLNYEVRLDRLLHIRVRRTQDLAWAAMEALRCAQVSAVLAVLSGMDLTSSRRLQLAAETNGTTGFFLGNAVSAPIASPITRWKVSPVGKDARKFEEPAWTIELLYCRGGRPASWIVNWHNGKLHTRIAQPVQQYVRQIEPGAMAG